MQAPATLSPRSRIVMVRPAHFGANPQTAATNAFQRLPSGPPGDIHAAACAEFDRLAESLDAAGIEVTVFPGNRAQPLPCETFCNNWVSTHADGTLVTYPMLAPNRRAERRADLLDWLSQSAGTTPRHIDLTPLEDNDEFLEGTGSLVFDHRHGIAYCCLSPRSSPLAIVALTAHTGWRIVQFEAADRHGQPIYHTNVMLSIGPGFAAICLEAIRDGRRRQAVAAELAGSGLEVIPLTLAQVAAFAGNLLTLEGREGPVIALSQTALASLDRTQRQRLEHHGSLLANAVPTIERVGGGSVRCLLLEQRLPAAPRSD